MKSVFSATPASLGNQTQELRAKPLIWGVHLPCKILLLSHILSPLLYDRPMKLFFGILMTISFSSFAKSYETNCFREHILESIAINKERKFAYSQLTEGKSDRIFNLLIGSEYLTLVPATYFDLKARKFQKNGSSLFCQEFMSMNRVGEFEADKLVVPEKKREDFDWKFHKTNLERAFDSRSSDLVRHAAIGALLELKKQPQYYCLTRHMFESIYRFAYFIPLREQEAAELKINPPTNLLFEVIGLHLMGLAGSYEIDEWSGPIQESGIPLLCSEFPDLIKDINEEELTHLKR